MIFHVFFLVSALFVYSLHGYQGSLGVMKVIPAVNASRAARLVKRGGQLTYFYPGTASSPGMGACEVPITNNDFIAALSAVDFGNVVPPRNSNWCNKCIAVNTPYGSVSVRVVDKCPSCKPGDLDISPAAFKKLTSLSVGRISNISWLPIDEVLCLMESGYQPKNIPIKPLPLITKIPQSQVTTTTTTPTPTGSFIIQVPQTAWATTIDPPRPTPIKPSSAFPGIINDWMSAGQSMYYSSFISISVSFFFFFFFFFLMV